MMILGLLTVNYITGVLFAFSICSKVEVDKMVHTNYIFYIHKEETEIHFQTPIYSKSAFCLTADLHTLQLYGFSSVCFLHLIIQF